MRGQRRMHERREASRGESGATPSREAVLASLQERFGFQPSLFLPYGLYMGSKGRVYLGPKTVPPGLRIVTIGLLVARAAGKVVKPTTNLLQVFGGHVTRNMISLEKEQALAYLKGEDVRIPGAVPGTTDGYVLVKYLGCPLGCALFRADTLKNMLPKAKRLSVRYI